MAPEESFAITAKTFFIMWDKQLRYPSFKARYRTLTPLSSQVHCYLVHCRPIQNVFRCVLNKIYNSGGFIEIKRSLIYTARILPRLEIGYKT